MSAQSTIEVAPHAAPAAPLHRGRVKIHLPTTQTAYPIVIGPPPRNWSAGSVDFAAVTAADSRDELLRLAGEQVALHLLEHEIRGAAAPHPTRPEDLDLDYLDEFEEDHEVVYVEPAKLSEFGVAIYRAMIEEGLSETELARRMGVSHTVANRISDPLYFGHTSNTLRKAARALGREIEVRLKEPIEPKENG